MNGDVLIGVDGGGTKTVACVVDPEGKLLGSSFIFNDNAFHFVLNTVSYFLLFVFPLIALD
jgi:predicted NBD/HSP70 family sugar kinase